MKISLKLAVSEETGHRTLDLEDLGVSKEEWDSMNDDAKQELLQDWVNDLPEHPYWCVDTFDTDEE